MNKQNRPLSNLAGYVVDMLKLASGASINLHGYMKYVVLRDLGRRTGARCFIESGTYLGVTAGRCARVFKKVLTIELDAMLAMQAAAYLKRFPNVEVIQGDAMKVLAQVIGRDDMDRAVVFLDGHFSGSETARGDVPEPAIEELVVLAQRRERICGIVVDDFRLFGVEPGFPEKSALVSTVERLFPSSEFELKVHADQVIVERRQA